MALQWYARYPGDYARDTAHLTMLEHGAYTLLMDYYYGTGEPLSAHADANAPTLALARNKRLYRVCRAVTQEEQEAVDSVIDDFFDLRDGKYHHDRIDQELEKRQEISEKRRAANEAMRAAREEKRKKKSANAPAHAHASGQQMHSTTTTTTTEVSISKDMESSGLPDTLPSSLLMRDGRFLSPDGYCEELWQLYPSVGRGKGHKGKFFDYVKKALKKGTDHEEIRAGVARYAEYCNATGELNKDAYRWARDAEWQNDYAISAAAHRPQQGNQSRERAGGLAQVIDAGEKAKEMLRRADEA